MYSDNWKIEIVKKTNILCCSDKQQMKYEYRKLMAILWYEIAAASFTIIELWIMKISLLKIKIMPPADNPGGTDYNVIVTDLTCGVSVTLKNSRLKSLLKIPCLKILV